MALNVTYICKKTHPGHEQRERFENQMAVEAFFDAARSEQVIHAYVFDERGITIAEWRIDLRALWAVPGRSGWMNRLWPA